MVLSEVIKALAEASAEKHFNEGMDGVAWPRGLDGHTIALTLHYAYNVSYSEALKLYAERFEEEKKKLNG